MAENNSLVPPKPSAGDRVHLLVKAALSVVPTLGGPAAELFAALVAPPIERRRKEWMEDVGKGLSGLLSRNLVTMEDLSANQIFLDTVLHASQAAMRTANEEKRAALRNAVLNAALPHPLDESLQLIFLELINQFTPWHLHLLKLFQSPATWALKHGNDFTSIYMGGISGILEIAFPELSGRRSFYDLVWDDLHQKHLVNSDSLHGLMTSTGLTEKRTTDLGDQFLRFIEDPESTISDA